MAEINKIACLLYILNVVCFQSTIFFMLHKLNLENPVCLYVSWSVCLSVWIYICAKTINFGHDV